MRRGQAALMAAILWSCATTGAAQEAVRSFHDLQALVHAGDVVTVRGHDGRRATGAIASLTDTTLVLSGDSAGRPWQEREVARVTQRHRDSLWNGALLGAFAGAAYIGTAVLVNGGLGEDSPEYVLGLGAMSAGLGALGGVAIDALVAPDRELFRVEVPPLTPQAGAGRARVGEVVVVTDPDGHEVRGRLVDLTPESLAVDVDGHIVEWRQGGWTLRQKQRDSLLNGTLIGAGVGLGVGFGLGVGVAASEVYAGESGTSSAGNAVIVIGTVAGAAIGLAIDGARQDELIVAGPRLSQSRVRLGVFPLVTRHAQGLGLALSF